MTTEQILQALEQFARKMRSASHWCQDNYYSTSVETALCYAKREESVKPKVKEVK